MSTTMPEDIRQTILAALHRHAEDITEEARHDNQLHPSFRTYEPGEVEQVITDIDAAVSYLTGTPAPSA